MGDIEQRVNDSEHGGVVVPACGDEVGDFGSSSGARGACWCSCVTPTFSTCIKVYYLVNKYLRRIIFKINYFAKHKI